MLQFCHSQQKKFIECYLKIKKAFLGKFVELPSSFENNSLNEKWNELIKIRNICNVSIEEKRASKEIGSSLEAEINIQLNNKLESM